MGGFSLYFVGLIAHGSYHEDGNEVGELVRMGGMHSLSQPLPHLSECTDLRLAGNDGVKVEELAEDANSEERPEEGVPVSLELRVTRTLALQYLHLLQTL